MHLCFYTIVKILLRNSVTLNYNKQVYIYLEKLRMALLINQKQISIFSLIHEGIFRQMKRDPHSFGCSGRYTIKKLREFHF